LTLWNFFFPYNNTHHNKKKKSLMWWSQCLTWRTQKYDTNFHVLLLLQVIGKFNVPIPITTPFVHMHSMCHLTHIIRQDDDDGMFFLLC
jgi:hypothetical protein